MANNIKIVGNIISTTEVSRYSSQDINLIPSRKLNENFGGKNDYIEFYIYDAAGNLLNTNYNYINYNLPTSIGLTPGTSTQPNTTGNIQNADVGIDSTLASTTGSVYPIIEIDPIQDLQNTGYSSGEFNTRYNLFTNILSNSINKALFIKEISQDRTEVRLGSISLTNDEIESTVLSMIDEINNSSYYVDYLLNFGNNIQLVAINVALNKAPEGYEVLFKLYEPLPVVIKEKMTLWVVEEKTNPYVFDINLDKFITPAPAAVLRGPNFSIEIPNQNTVSTAYLNYSNALTSLQLLQSSSYNQLMNLMSTQSIQINVDYTDFNNFTFFGSAYQRVTNFYTKVKQIESYTGFINYYTPYVATTASLQTQINQYSSSIVTTISQFDGYESYLYFESSSYAWPKSGSLKPFSLLSTGSAATKTWYNTLTASAKTYDLNNYDNLEYAVPSFIKDDSNNNQYLTFLNMVGQYFDNIWIYLKAITDINLANNNLNAGISKDLVYQQLQSLGIKLYNSQAGKALDNYLIGANTGSTIFNNDFSLTSSFLNNIPRKDLTAELYKRIYHNLPLLLKTKGTTAGLEQLISAFGIPSQTYYTITSASISETFYTPTGSNFTSSILSVNEFGGSLKANLIKGYNNEKVRIVSNTIAPGVSGSVLSPLLSLQTYPTDSAAFRDSDMNYVDISFSPQTQMDTYISKSIASNNATWSLDDYIGDPRQQYSGSYPDLDAQRKLYFQTGVPGFAPFTGSSLDYNGFIRLIQYFDNSLFKMLGDFVPERTSLSTGVTINSPVLERNKAVYANPSNTTTQSVWEAEYPAPTISSQYGTFYNTLSSSDNTMGWFDGELSGSTVNVYQYFTDNYNSYLQPTGAIDQNMFAHSDWNVLLNNVSASVLSNKRQQIEYTANFLPTSSIKTKAELQDSYLSLQSYNISRYEGSKVSSLKYNTWQSGSSLYSPTASTSASFLINFNWNNIPPINQYPVGTNYYDSIYMYAPADSTQMNFINKLGSGSNNQFITSNSGSGNIGTNNGYIYNYNGYRRSGSSDYVFIAVSGDRSQGASQTIQQAIANAPSGFPTQSITLVSLNPYSYYVGDNSYGKTAAIDRQSYKVGWVKNIPSQSLNFYDKTQIQLKYLVDKEQNLTDLTLKNNNIFEVQNIFKTGDTVVLSLSDAIRPSFQKTLDGTKSIFKGGYSFDPILYRENSEVLKFKFVYPQVSGSTNNGIKSVSSQWYNSWNSGCGNTNSAGRQAWSIWEINDINGWRNATAPDTVPTPCTYKAMVGGGTTTNIFSAPAYAVTMTDWNNSDKGLHLDVSCSWHTTFSPPSLYRYTRLNNLTCGGENYIFNNDNIIYAYIYNTTFSGSTSLNGGYYREASDVTDNGRWLYKAPRTSTYEISGSLCMCFSLDYYYRTFSGCIMSYHTNGVGFKIFGLLEKSSDNGTSWTYVASTKYNNVIVKNGGNSVKIDYDINAIQLTGGGTDRPYEDYYNQFAVWEFITDNRLYDRRQGSPTQNTQVVTVDLNAGDILRFNPVLIDLDRFFAYGRDHGITIGRPNNYDGNSPIGGILPGRHYYINLTDFANIPLDYIAITDVTNKITVYDDTRIITDPEIFTASSGSSTIGFTTNLTELITTASLFQPTVPTSNNYSSIIDATSIQPNDLIRIGAMNDPVPEYYTITDITSSRADIRNDTYISIASAEIWSPTQMGLPPLASGASLGFPTIHIPYSQELFNFCLDVFNSDKKLYLSNFFYSNTTTANGVYTPYIYSQTFYNSNGYLPLNNTYKPFITYEFSGATAATRRKIDQIVIPLGSTQPSSTIFTLGRAYYLYNNTIYWQYKCDLRGGKTKYKYSANITPPYAGTKQIASQNFAILRPKPDETSVIIDFRKSPGDVSQTILIPQDANDGIKNNIGNIFQSLNVDLSNTSQNVTQ